VALLFLVECNRFCNHQATLKDIFLVLPREGEQLRHAQSHLEIAQMRPGGYRNESSYVHTHPSWTLRRASERPVNIARDSVAEVCRQRWHWMSTVLKRLASAVRFRPWPPLQLVKHSALTRLFFRPCQICVVDFPNQGVLPALILLGPLGIVATDRGGTIPEDCCYFLKGSALP
jgi:hypothetical protein